MYGSIRPITVLTKSNCSGSEIAIAAAATPDAKRIAVPSDAPFSLPYMYGQIFPFYGQESKSYTIRIATQELILQKSF